MFFVSNEINSSSSNMSLSATAPNILILEKIKEAHNKKKAILKDDHSKQIPEKILDKQSKYKKLSEALMQNSLLDSSIHRKMNLLKKTVIQENNSENIVQKNLGEKFSISTVTEDNSKSKLYNKRRDKIFSLYSDADDDDDDEDFVPKETVLHLRKPLVNKQNEAIYYNDYGRMEPIDWSTLYNEEKDSQKTDHYEIIQNEIEESFGKSKKTSETIPEANIEFINFVNNSITQETVYNAKGNVIQICNAIDSPLLKLQRKIQTSIETNVTISEDVKKAFEPSESKLHLINMIDLQTNELELLQNGKSKANYEFEIDQNCKASNLNHSEDNELKKSQISLKSECTDTKKNVPNTNDMQQKVVDKNDYRLNYVKLDKSKSSSSINIVNLKDNEMSTFYKDAKLENSNKNSFYNKLKKIYKKQSSYLDSDDTSEHTQPNSNHDSSSIRFINQYKPQSREDDDTVNTKFKHKVCAQDIELINYETIIKETYTKNLTISSNDTVLEKNEIKSIKNTSNEEAYINSKKSRYFLKLLNLVEKEANETEKKYDRNEIEKKYSNLSTGSNVKHDKTECDQNTCLTVENNMEKLPASIKEIHDSNEVLNDTSKMENESFNLDLVSKNNLHFDESLDTEEEFDFQDPNEDTEWNDILRRKGIIPEKKKDAEVTEDQIIQILENTIDQKTGRAKIQLENKTLDELDELEDEEDEKILLEYRRKRIAEIQELANKAKYGTVTEISAQDYVQQVNNAGDDIWVILHLYKAGIPLCSLINQHLVSLAKKFPMTKFLKSISTTCIPNFPDANLPTIFIYKNGNMEKKFVGPIELRGMKLTEEEFEWMLGEAGAVPTKLKSDPKPKIRDVLFAKLVPDELNDCNDW